jgi:hypothetical protein
MACKNGVALFEVQVLVCSSYRGVAWRVFTVTIGGYHLCCIYVLKHTTGMSHLKVIKMHFLNSLFNSILFVFCMFRTSYVHHQEEYIVHVLI